LAPFALKRASGSAEIEVPSGWLAGPTETNLRQQFGQFAYRMPVAFSLMVSLMLAVRASEEIDQAELTFAPRIVGKEDCARLAMLASDHHVPLGGVPRGKPDHTELG